MNIRTPLKCFCLVASAFLSVHALADIYKCTDDAGNISYVQNPTNDNCVLLEGSAATTDTTIVAPTVVSPETVRDPGVNQPGAAGNARPDPGYNQPGAVGNVGGAGADLGNKQPGAAGNVKGAKPHGAKRKRPRRR